MRPIYIIIINIIDNKDGFQVASGDVNRLKVELKQLEKARCELAAQWCEEPSKFNLEEALAVFRQFCAFIHQCRKVG